MNGNGHPGGGVLARLRYLLDHHQSAAKAIQTTLGLLDTDATTKKRQTSSPLLTQALRLDAVRRRGRPRKGTRAAFRAVKKYNKAAAMAKRKSTAAFLRLFSEKPRELPKGEDPHRIGVLVQHGYLKNTDDGLVRTDKPFTA